MILRGARIKDMPDKIWWMVLAVPVLLPFSNIATYVMGIFAIGGIIIAIHQWRKIWSSDAARCLFVLFLCLWIPMLLALPDAASLQHSLKSTLGYLHLMPAALFMLWLMRDKEGSRHLQIWFTLLLAFWSFDILFQYITGFNLLGFPYEGKRVTGMFYPKSTMGIVLAAFSPIYFTTLQTSMRKSRFAWFLAPLLVIAILLSGSRASWLMLGIALVFAVWRMRDDLRLSSWRSMTARFLVGVVIVISIVASSSYHLKHFSLDALERGMHPRVELWTSAYKIWKDHWLNGIGVRGYRYVMPLPEYVTMAPGKHIVSPKTGLGQPHPHLILAEIAAETGMMGIAGFVLFWITLIRYLRRLSPDMQWKLMPCVVTLVVIMLPLNAHKAFYSTFYSTIVWWMISLLLASSQLSQTVTKADEFPSA